jgi:hypothetical protein
MFTIQVSIDRVFDSVDILTTGAAGALVVLCVSISRKKRELV